MAPDREINKTDFISVLINKAKNFLKLTVKVIIILIWVITVLAALMTVFGIGTDKTKDIIKSIVNDFLMAKAFFQAIFLLTLLAVIFSAIFCVVIANKIYMSLNHECEENDRRLKNILNLLEREKELGISAINKRKSSFYSNEAYKKIFRATSEELVISGHSLNRTINQKTSLDLRREFSDTIIRLLEKERSVKILLVKPNESNESKEKRQKFNEFVVELNGKLKGRDIHEDIILKNLHIKETDFLPYYIVKNEEILYIAHYTFGDYSSSSDDNMYIFETNSNFGYGKHCYEDFFSCFDKAEYIEQYNSLFKRDENA